MPMPDNSIVQGLGIGPPSYAVRASDLHPVRPGNVMAKYTDDIYLLIGASRRGTMEDELKSVAKWATISNTRINQFKSCEQVHRRRSASAMQAPIRGIQRVQTKYWESRLTDHFMLHHMLMQLSQLAPGLCSTP